MSAEDGATRDAGTAAGLAVCIITYRRPRALEKLLGSLARQQRIDPRDLRIVVVDNDPALSARPVVESAECAGIIEYGHEPTPGIPRARNRSIDLALRGGAQRLCFIDDDEHASADWLARLLAHAATTDAPVVTGPVLSVLPEEADPVFARSRLFSRQRYPTGTRRDRAATNNVLVERRVFEAMEQWFDESAPLNGSDDSDFFRRVHRGGFAIERCDEAVVYEDVPLERCSMRWVGRRCFRGGLGFASQARRHDGVATVARNLPVGLARLVWAAAMCVGTLGIPAAARLRIVENAGLGAGLVLGCFGVSFDEYRRA